MARKLKPKGTGTLEWREPHWYVRVFISETERPRYRLCAHRPDCNCATLSEAYREDMRKAISERERARVHEEQAAESRARAEKRLTVKQFGERWTSGKLYEEHGEVRKLRPKKSAHSDEVRLVAHVYPDLGNKLVAEVTELDVERCLAAAAARAKSKLGRPWRQRTRLHVYQTMHRLFDLAIKPGRLRTDNPVSEDLKPSKDGEKLYSFLYPRDLTALLACKEVPIARRVHYAMAVYTGLRKGSLRALTFAGVDFQNRILTSLESKTGLPQAFEISTDICTVLQAWHEHLGRPEKSTAIVRDLECKEDREAETLRADLKAAGVDREILFSDADNVEPLRFHDMRATFVTWAKRQGRGDGWISDRTGHLTKEMIERYNRGARSLADLRYEPFPDISMAIPELADLPGNVRRVDFRR